MVVSLRLPYSAFNDVYPQRETHMTLRIGAGAGFAGDRIDPARDLAERGALDYLAFECLAERTLAYGHLQRMADPAKGFHLLIEKRLGAVLAACVANRTTIITCFEPVAASRSEPARRHADDTVTGMSCSPYKSSTGNG